jgi:hypothetical protein
LRQAFTALPVSFAPFRGIFSFHAAPFRLWVHLTEDVSASNRAFELTGSRRSSEVPRRSSQAFETTITQGYGFNSSF